MKHKDNAKGTSILLIGPFPENTYNVGGVSIWNKRVVNEFVRRHIEVAVVPWYGAAPTNASQKILLMKEKNPRFWASLGANLFLKLPALIYFLMRRYLVSPKDLYRMMRLFVYLNTVLRQLDRKRRYIILASHVGFRSLLAVWLKQKLPQTICAIDIHGSGILEFAETHRKLVRFLLDSADKIFVRSDFIRRECLKRGASAEKVFIIPCGIEVKGQEEMPRKDNIVIFCGALEPHKDPLTLLKAIPFIRKHAPEDTRVVFIGEGELKDQMAEIIAKEKLDDSVRLLGSLPNEEVARYLRRAKLLVLPSIREAFGIVLLEALSSFTPCVVTNVGGMPEIVTTAVGYVVEPQNPKAIADASLELINNETLWERKAREAYQRALQYDMKNIGNLLVRALNLDNS